jgi:hypothetical protein
MTDIQAAEGAADVEMGPIDYLVIEFPGNRMTGEGWPILVDLVDRGIIRILDLAFIRKEEDGSVAGLTLQDLGEDGVELTAFEGASSGLLGDEDLAEAAAAVEPGCSAGVLLYENTWAGPFAAAMRRSGGELVAFGRIPINALLAAVEGDDDE